MIAEVKSTPDFRKKENRRKPEITFSFNVCKKIGCKKILKKISTQGLTVLIIRAILHIEQRKRDKRKVPEFRKQSAKINNMMSIERRYDLC